jgi:hypothetical protein
MIARPEFVHPSSRIDPSIAWSPQRRTDLDQEIHEKFERGDRVPFAPIVELAEVVLDGLLAPPIAVVVNIYLSNYSIVAIKMMTSRDTRSRRTSCRL